MNTNFCVFIEVIFCVSARGEGLTKQQFRAGDDR